MFFSLYAERIPSFLSQSDRHGNDFFIPELGFACSIIFSTKALFAVVRTYSLHLYLEKLPIREENFYA